jgi:UDP-glucose 4-epimerase
MDKITVVTGGCGFIGHHLVKRLVDIGKTVVVLDNLSTGRFTDMPEGATLYKMDLTIDAFPNLQNVDAIYHLAATTSVEESLSNAPKYKANILSATKRLLIWAADINARRIVMASTAAVYGDPAIIPTHEGVPVNPMSPYAEYKWRAENHLAHCHGKGLTTACLRFFNVFGEGQPTSGSYAPAVARFMTQYNAFEPITVTGDGSQTRDYIYVKDVVAALIMAMSRDNFFILNIGSGEELSILEVAESFGGEIQFVPKRNEPYQSCADIKMATIELGWTPSTSIISWIKKNK